MNVTGNTRQGPTTEGSASGKGRRRIRPSRARGLRTRTGCLTCRERRVKCDDGKPTCLRCSKSHRVCRYTQDAFHDVDQTRAATVGNNRDVTRAQPDSSVEWREVVRVSDDLANDIHATQAVSQSPHSQQGDIGTATHFQASFSASDENAVPMHRTESTEIPHNNNLNEPNQQSLPSFGSTFSESPLSLSQVSLLNISPFEWYDLLARDAISNIQHLSHTSNGDLSWKSFELALSRKQSPVPECAGPQLEQARRPDVQQHEINFNDRDGRPDESSSNDQRSSELWNTTTRIKLSEIDLKFFRYYVEIVGPILDLFDPARHFSYVVPHLALQNFGLLKSILAVGAKHMSLYSLHAPDGGVSGNNLALDASPPIQPARTGLSPDSDHNPRHMATQYYYETLGYLSKTLLYPSYAESHEILATATMISTYEMFDADSAPSRGVWEQHLRGSFWIQRSQDNDGESIDGLRQAVWWAWLRQDIWAAFQAGRPTITFWNPRKPLEDLNSDELATRILYLCGKCVKYAASDGSLSNQDPWMKIKQGDRLLCALDDWRRALPASYQPVTTTMNATSNTVFPPIWIHPMNHAGAIQMYHFARTAVLLNQPTMGGLSTYMQREKQLTESVKVVCGIANSCQENEPAMAFVNVQLAGLSARPKCVTSFLIFYVECFGLADSPPKVL
ncbi:Putative Dihydroxyacetone synthase [Penicillium brasilianum]|uniref:Putative Dihydroxyacetone synthase n=1 Tax=Penicillium brasilianum TaxID=104259 RepID=A0A0F7TUI0_PENBI|nr:Putative Dihydroxyacetone synthase [Penicillium brasilianum]